MSTVSAVIMAHPARELFAEQLEGWLGVPVQWDPVSTPSEDPEQRWANGREAWLRQADSGADWSMVVQDDAVPCEDLLETLSHALDHVPDEAIVSAYLGTKRPAQYWYQHAIAEAEKTGASWIRAKSLSWGVAPIVPTATIRDMIVWCDQQLGMSYDMRVGRYYRDVLYMRCWHPWPSLVDHRHDIPSLCGHDEPDRRAHRHHRGSGLELAWDGPVATDPRISRSKPKRAAK